MEKLTTSFLHSELNRVTKWIEFSDAKSGFIAAFYTLTIGFFIAEREQIIAGLLSYEGCRLFIFIFVLTVAAELLLAGFAHLMSSVVPNLKKRTSGINVFYFGDVAGLSSSNYVEKMGALSEEDVKKHLLEQIHCNSTIAGQKMRRIKGAIVLLSLLAICLIALAFLMT